MLLLLMVSNLAMAQFGFEGCHRVKNLHHQDRSNILTVTDIQKTEMYDVHHYFLDLEMSNLNTEVSGSVEMHAKSLVPMNELVFELHSNLNISELLIDGSPQTFTRNTSGVYVPVNMAQDSSFICKITYSGTAPDQSSNPLGGGGLTTDNSPTWGNQATWSLSEPYSAFEWFPCKQSLTDKIDSTRCHFTIDNALKAGSNGVLVNDIDLGNGKHRMEWKSNYPVVYYLISVAIAEYVDYSFYAHPSITTDSILVQNYIYNNPATLPNFQNDIDETADFIELYSNLYGLYPFHEEKYGHCMAPLSGGMEHQTMTTQGYFVPALTAHELAHQWFGDYVTCGSWSDLWLNEGFATYSEYIMFENLYPGQEVGDMLNTHNSVMSAPDGSVWIEDSLNTGRLFNGRLTYNKGAAILHTLRYIVNDDNTFFDIFRAYLNAHAFNTAIASDFFSIAETESGLDLSDFVNEWYYGEGFPTYNGTWNQINGELIFNLNQSTSAPSSVSLFTNPVDITVERQSLPDTIIRLEVDQNSEYFSGTISGTITNLKIDEANWIVNDGGNMVFDAGLIGIEEINQLELNIYPNPTEDLLNITANSTINFIELVDNRGRIVVRKTPQNNNTLVDISDFERGVYFLNIGLDNRIERRKISKL